MGRAALRRAALDADATRRPLRPGRAARGGGARHRGVLRRAPYFATRSELNRPAWSESQKPFTGCRPSTDDLTSFTLPGLFVITWSTLWSKSAALPPPPLVSTFALRQQPSGLLVARSTNPAPVSAAYASPSPGLTSVFVSELRSPSRITGSLPVAGPPDANSAFACASRICPFPTSVSLLVWLLAWLSNASRCVFTKRNLRLLPTLASTAVKPSVTSIVTPAGFTRRSVSKWPALAFAVRTFVLALPPTRARIASRIVRRPLISLPSGQFGPDVDWLPSVFAYTSKSNSGCE